MDRNEWNKRIRDNVDSLLAERGFAPDCSIRNQLACMNFSEDKSIDFIDACAAQQEAIQAQTDEYEQGMTPAFPFGQVSEQTGQPINGFFNAGITTRDYFAAAALTGYCANPSTWHKCFGHEEADYCYKIADQMIHERTERNPF